ncbi:hypothetical protein GNF68_16435, partial [Clostridium perfringens]
GILLIAVTIVSVVIANSNSKELYDKIFHHITLVGDFNLHDIINDFLMAIFFLYVGLEIKKSYFNMVIIVEITLF